MFYVILFMFAGIISGFLFRKQRIHFLNGIILTLIWALLFLLGLEIGTNDNIIHNFHKLGFEAFLIAFFGTLGSILGARFLFPPIQTTPELKNITFNKNTKSRFSFQVLKSLKGSLVILSFFAAGIFFGYFHVLPEGFISSVFSFYVLCALMFSVGFSLGHQPETVKHFRRIQLRILFLPLTTIAGTWLGVVVVSFFTSHTLTDYLAIGSGFGYYSLSSILITEYKGIELGTIALLANIFREILTLVFAPQMVRYFGRLAPIAAGGATTMDTTFPIIIQTSGKEYSVVSIYSGFVLDFSVPFLVTFWCSF